MFTLNRENVVLGFAVGFFTLAFLSLFVGISTHVLTVLSLSSALFALAQTLENNLAAEDEEHKKMVDVFNQTGNMNLSNEWMLFCKKYIQELFSSKAAKRKQKTVMIIECASVVILVVGMAIPAKVFEIGWIARVSTIIPFGFLFLSIWQLERSKKKIQLWEEMQLFSMAFQNSQPNNSQNIQVVEDTSNGQT